MKVQSKKDEYIVKCENKEQTNNVMHFFDKEEPDYDWNHWSFVINDRRLTFDDGDFIERSIKPMYSHLPIISFEEWQILPDFPKPEYDPKDVAFNNSSEWTEKLTKENPWSIKVTEEMMNPDRMSLEEFETECGQNFSSKPIIGYKLIKPEYKEAAKIIALSHVGEKIKYYKGNIETIGIKNGASCKKALEEAGVLSLWFEPIYDTSITLKSGVKLSEDDIAEVKEILNNK